MNEVLLSADKWQEIASTYSAHLAVEQKGSKPISVQTAPYGGYHYTVFGVVYGPWGVARKPFAEAYKLLPLSMYSGETTTVYHDEEAIRSGARKRGDLTGLIVSVGRQLVVCAERVRFLMDLPRTRPLSLSEASAYDERQRKVGWRSLLFNSKTPDWSSLEGHPVAVYRGHKIFDDEDKAVLLWKHDGAIHELWIDNDVPLGSDGNALAVPVAASGIQMALF